MSSTPNHTAAGTMEQALVTRLSKKELAKWTEEYAMQYRELMTCCRCAMLEIETKLQVLGEDYALQFGGSPITSIRSELKSPEGIADRILAGGFPLTVESMEQNIHDIAQVRVVCMFPTDLYRLAEALQRQDGVDLLGKEDFIAEPKESGYRGLHLILSTPVTLRGRTRQMKVEVVFRTEAMELWASAEEKFLAAQSVFLPEQVDQELRACAELSVEWDQRLEQIRYNVEHHVITK